MKALASKGPLLGQPADTAVDSSIPVSNEDGENPASEETLAEPETNTSQAASTSTAAVGSKRRQAQAKGNEKRARGKK